MYSSSFPAATMYLLPKHLTLVQVAEGFTACLISISWHEHKLVALSLPILAWEGVSEPLCDSVQGAGIGQQVVHSLGATNRKSGVS